MIKLQLTRERVNSNGGQVLVGALLDRFGFDGAVDAIRVGDCANRAVRTSSCLRAYVGLLAEGRTAFDEVEVYRGDELFRQALKLQWVPFSPTLRQRLTGARGRLDPALAAGNVKFLSSCSIGSVRTGSGDRVSRRRIRKVIQDIVRFACKFVQTARQVFLKIRYDNPWTPTFRRLYSAYT